MTRTRARPLLLGPYITDHLVRDSRLLVRVLATGVALIWTGRIDRHTVAESEGPGYNTYSCWRHTKVTSYAHAAKEERLRKKRSTEYCVRCLYCLVIILKLRSVCRQSSAVYAYTAMLQELRVHRRPCCPHPVVRLCGGQDECCYAGLRWLQLQHHLRPISAHLRGTEGREAQMQHNSLLAVRLLAHHELDCAPRHRANHASYCFKLLYLLLWGHCAWQREGVTWQRPLDVHREAIRHYKDLLVALLPTHDSSLQWERAGGDHFSLLGPQTASTAVILTVYRVQLCTRTSAACWFALVAHHEGLHIAGAPGVGAD